MNRVKQREPATVQFSVLVQLWDAIFAGILLISMEYHERQVNSGSVANRDITPSDSLQAGQSLTTIMKTSSL
ncbi:unnamed protein product [Nezara viridula]|uniref:Uncharacterized protein n=1 Tax=Nezara viridula TaxID=85310 RepID=A0A9P0DZH5_NEZVI|nr:unnamed protein product [Nezara viridula]